MADTLEAVKELRRRTNAGVIDCKKALKEANGQMEKAIELLRKKGAALAAEKASRVAKQGLVASYIHLDGKVGALVEINCETDFVAKNEEFKKFFKDITMQVVGANSKYIKKEEVPKEVVDKESEIIKAQIKDKPEAALKKITEGKLEKFYSEVCLLEQPFVKDPKIKIKDYLASTVGQLGENIIIKRFVLYRLGQE